MTDSRRDTAAGPFDAYPEGDPDASARMVELRREAVRVVEAGERIAPPVVLLHGWGASAYSYRLVVPMLARHGLRAIAPDLRGHGWSTAPSDAGWYSSAAMVDWVQHLLDALGVGRCVLVGQSIGGAIALDAAVTLGDRVAAAVLLAPIGFTRIARVALARSATVSAWRPATAPRWMVRQVLRRIYGEHRQWTERDVDQYWHPLRTREYVAAMFQMLREFDFAPRLANAGAGARLVVRFGERDRLIPWRRALRHASGFEGVNAAMIPGAGHVPAEEVPDEVAALIVAAAASLRRHGR